MTHYDALPPERWARFDLGQQILQIGVEMQRASKFLLPRSSLHLRSCYERAMELVDLTVQVQPNPSLRRELLRWREVVGELYLRAEPDERAHRQALRLLLRLHPESAKQIAVLAL
jgi:hypothetical protein